jgi:hypothetical protein
MANQTVPSSFVTLSQPKIHELWEKVSPYEKLYPGDPRFNIESFCDVLLSNRSVAFELDNGLVVLYNIEKGLRADLRMTFWDKHMLDKLPQIQELLLWAFIDLDLYRIGMTCGEYELALERFITKRLAKLHNLQRPTNKREHLWSLTGGLSWPITFGTKPGTYSATSPALLPDSPWVVLAAPQ